MDSSVNIFVHNMDLEGDTKLLCSIVAVPVFEEHPNIPDILLWNVWDEEKWLIWSLRSLWCPRLWKGIHHPVYLPQHDEMILSSLLLFTSVCLCSNRPFSWEKFWLVILGKTKFVWLQPLLGLSSELSLLWQQGLLPPVNVI